MQEDSMDEKNFDKLLSNKKRFTTEALKRAVAREDYSRLEGLAELADRQGCSKKLRRQAWLMVGKNCSQQRDHFGAIYAINSARRAAPSEETIAVSFYSEVNALLDQLSSEASREDIIQVQEFLVPVANQYRSLHVYPNLGRELIEKTERLIPILKSATETKWTFRITELNDAIKEGMTTKEVKIELARIFAPALRKLYDEVEKKQSDGKTKKKNKSKASGKKKPKPKS